jgi:hypothetical protein
MTSFRDAYYAGANVRQLSLILGVIAIPTSLIAQHAEISGYVKDPSGAVVPGAIVKIVSVDRGWNRATSSNSDGIYSIPGLDPGKYELHAEKQGFQSLVRENIVLEVAQRATVDLELRVGDVAQVLTVDAGSPMINTADASVSAVVDRQFVGEIPLNARSLQSLIALVPGMTRAAVGSYGQFNANGQRDDANYFTIDGVSANGSAGHTVQGATGGQPALSVLGTTNNLISVDAMEEFRISTSTFAPEYGRTPGAQVAIISRSGTNQFHGVLVESFRNDIVDANNWFNNAAGVSRPPTRQNQFGGVLGGPILKNRTFAFVSYEGLRLRQPTTFLGTAPSLRLRQLAAPAVQTLLNAYPVPTLPEIGTSGFSPYTASFSPPSSMDASSVRIDHLFNSRFALFGRYNQAPSATQAPVGSDAAQAETLADHTRTFTAGLEATVSPRVNNEFRANYSSDSRTDGQALTTFGGARPFTLSQVLSVPNAFFESCFLNYSVCDAVNPPSSEKQVQRQFNVVDNLSYNFGRHQFKFGIDFRQLEYSIDYAPYAQLVTFDSGADIQSSTATTVNLSAQTQVTPILRNFSAYAQDTWKITPRLAATYGVRWDVNPAPTEANGKQPYVVRGLSDSATAQVELLPKGEQLWNTRWANIAARIGLAYQLRAQPAWDTVLRGGVGLFYDLGTGSSLWPFANGAPFSAFSSASELPYPLSAANAAPPSLAPTIPSTLNAYDPSLKLPHTWEWNLAVEQSLGNNQTLAVTYVGAAGRKLLRATTVENPLPNIPTVQSWTLETNGSSSDYDSLQIRFQRRLKQGLQVLASYTWAHSIDDLSDSLNIFGWQPQRADSDFDVRHNVAAAITYDVPAPPGSGVLKTMFGNWAIDATIRADSSTPFTVHGPRIVLPDGRQVDLLPNLLPGVPEWIDDPNVAGGRRLNPVAFVLPSTGKQGDLPRNSLRGFPFSQTDVAIKRTFPVGERWRIVFRAEAFNALNHPDFANPGPFNRVGTPLFGQSVQMLNTAIGQVQGSGTSPLYESGGPRSMQIVLRVEF